MNTKFLTALSVAACRGCIVAVKYSVFFLSLLTFSHAAHASSLSLGPFGQGVYSGTEPFNTSGKCHESGDDCGNDDNRVRTGDLIQFSWSIAANDFAPGEAEIPAVIFEQTITASADAIVRFDRVPTVCLAHPAGPGGDNPTSSLTLNNDGSHTLICNLGEMGEGEQKSFSIPVRPSANSHDNSTFRSNQKVYALNHQQQKIVADVEHLDSTIYQVSAAPAFDLIADRKDMYKGTRVVEDLGLGVGPEPGYMVYLNAQIAADALRKGKGSEALNDLVTFKAQIKATNKDGVTPITIPYKMLECAPNSTPWPGTVYGNEKLASKKSLNAKVVDSGTCSFSGDAINGHQFTLKGIDSQGNRYPTETITGQSLATGPFYVASYQIGFFVPFSAIEASDDDTSGNGGAINLSTCLSEFDPTSSTGVSNYASGVEPGFNGEAMPDGTGSNNCTGPLTLQLSSAGGFNHRLVSTATDEGDYTIAPLIDTDHSGATAVESTTRYAHMETFSNTGSTALDNFQACFRFDSTVSKLVDAAHVGASNGQYAFIANDTSAQFDRSRWQVLYGQADYGVDSPLDKNADGVDDFDATTGRYEGSWETMRTAVCNEDIAPQWVRNPNEIGIDSVNVVRFVKRADSASIEPGQVFKAFLPLEMRETFAGGANDGQAIPVGTVAAAMSSFRTDQFYPRWRPVQYTPSPESSQGDGERVTFTKIGLNAVISTRMPQAAAGITKSVLAGNDVVWEISVGVNSKLPDGGIAKALRIVSELPMGSAYNADCTAQLNQGSIPNSVRYNTPSAGKQTLYWDIGDVHTTDTVRPILFCASTDPFADEGTVRITKAFAQADNATASVPTEQAIALGQTGEIRTAAAIDVQLDSINDTQVHTLKWLNFSETTAIASPVMINVLPYVGDNQGLSQRDPASQYAGTLRLLSEPVASFANGTVPHTSERAIGDLYYTSDNAESISDNPALNTSYWCRYSNGQFSSVSSFTGACPTTFAEVSGIKFVANYDLEPLGHSRRGQQLEYTLSAQQNEPGDGYTNAFGLTSSDLPTGQVIRSRAATVTIASHSIGDFIFVDVNGDGKYTKQVDVIAPDGISVELRRSIDDELVAATKTQGGTFIFNRLGDGDYYVVIPATEFAAHRPLRNWGAAPNGQASDADANHDQDHSGFVEGSAAVSGVRTDQISVSASLALTPTDAPFGKEPLGDNLFGLDGVSTNDDFSNLTVDIGLSSGDADGDGILDIFEFGSNGLSGFVDTDSDGLPNYLDTDSDNDGITDGIEARVNVDTLTSLPEPNSADATQPSTDIADNSNGSGTGSQSRIADIFLWGMRDSDNDGLTDYQDVDSDNDGIPDSFEYGAASVPSNTEPFTHAEYAADSDGDGVPNYIDLDSDNDGLSDSLEARVIGSVSNDSDGDGIANQFDATNTSGVDANADDVDDNLELIDRDGDGVPDYIDDDSDNDGLADLEEYGGVDVNGDGQIDNFIDNNADGVHDGVDIQSVTVGDADNDGIPDTHDFDSDADGVPDVIELFYASTIDSDQDGLPVQLDLDSDNDGIADGVEFGITGLDDDGDGIDNLFDVDTRVAVANLISVSQLQNDRNADGIDDRALRIGMFDTDGDGISNPNDVDSDNDGLSDAFESRSGDADNDHQLDAFVDVNNDGIDDKRMAYNFPSAGVFTLPDADGDGQPDVYDRDSDNDGLPDALEYRFIDFDGDGIPDYRDIDSDNDGLHDRFEAESIVGDADRDGISNVFDADVTLGPDQNKDGIDDRLTTANLLDSDGDGFPDHLDLDSDGDTLSDLEEAGGGDMNADGKVDGFSDQDNNGGHDGLGQTGLSVIDTDNDGEPDTADTDADNDGIPDFIEVRISDNIASDIDNDGIPDFRDTDADNDGIGDGMEAGLVIGTRVVDSQSLVTDDPFYNPFNVASNAPATMGFNYSQVLDSDGDGIPDLHDLDSDNDGVPDAIEFGANVQVQSANGDTQGNESSDNDANSVNLRPVDSDNDGIVDYLDVDSDNDGLADQLEGLGDRDADGLPDRLDIDSDDDGIVDAFESSLDFDNDAIPNFRDTDSDDDGIRDAVERGDALSGIDSNNDSIPDFLSTDSDGDGVPDAIEFGANGDTNDAHGLDSDADGTPDFQDKDSDNDGLSDSLEAGANPAVPTDSDSDSIPDMLDSDSDNDGISDSVEGFIDSDSDGAADYIDADSNDDGTPDQQQGAGDNNGDGVADRIAASTVGSERLFGLMHNVTPEDSDGDGILNAIESGQSNPATSLAGARDSDGDGIADMFDLDSDNDGIPDLIEAVRATASTNPASIPLDSDGDAQPDYIDPDSDNDGVLDAIEGLLDFDNDTILDFRDTDSDNDGISDAIELHIDSDGDGVVNRHDNDSDNDGISDQIEGSTDNTDVLINGSDQGTTSTVLGHKGIDSDQDGLPNFIDNDSDNDGLSDTLERGTNSNTSLGASNTPLDSDRDGLPNYIDTDSDNDSIKDASELAEDSDGDGLPNYIDSDGNGNGINDLLEHSRDTDSDGIHDIHDSDNDNDGIPDGIDGFVDTDSDGVPNYHDTDSDGDGIADSIEAGVTPTVKLDSDGDGIEDRLDLDSDNDGVPDFVEGSVDSDLDGLPDHLDLDSDNDGISDVLESGRTDANGDGLIDSFIDDNRDGISDQIDLLSPPEFDADGDGVADRLEAGPAASMQAEIPILTQLIDSDGDGIPDRLEGEGDHDSDGLPNKSDLDSDNDAILDEYEFGFTLYTGKDSDADGYPDFLDNDSDNDGLSDIAEALGIAYDQDADGFIDNFIDVNRNGVDDAIDTMPVYPEDIDNDGIADHLDLDSDGDGIFDLTEVNGQDNDGDGTVDGQKDTDADRIPDIVDVDQTLGADSDGDGIDDIGDADFYARDLDEDADGIINRYDLDNNGNGFATTGIADGAPGVNWPDTDGDGIPDVKQSSFAQPLDDEGVIRTGTDGEGSGCSVSANDSGRLDPILLLMTLLSLIFIRRSSSKR